ncbi:tRNA (adenosine(37)-N6)-dimethylallyltransferase MiaA, partial [Gardnerella vaginalis]
IRPILVGGSGLYARAAVDDITFPGTDPNIRKALEDREKSQGAMALFEELQKLDPVAAKNMDPRNSRRTIRALEVIELTGKPYSATLPKYKYLIDCVQIGLDLNREDLDARVELRTKMMREQGFVNEVKEIRSRLGVTASRALGYKQIMDYLDGLCSEDDAFADIAQKTKRLARKQMGWFGRDSRIHWVNALQPDVVDVSMKIINAADNGDFKDDLIAESTSHHLGALIDE